MCFAALDHCWFSSRHVAYAATLLVGLASTPGSGGLPSGGEPQPTPRVARLTGSYSEVVDSPDGNAVAVGVDGISVLKQGSQNWVAQPVDLGFGWTSVATDGKGTWLAVGRERETAELRPGSDKWVKLAAPGLSPQTEVTRVVYGLGTWVAISPSGLYQRPVGGGQWEARAGAPRIEHWSDVAHGADGTWVAVGRKRLATRRAGSADWTVETSSCGDLHAIGHHDGNFMALGRQCYATKSKDSKTWTFGKDPSLDFVPRAVAFGGGRWIAVGLGGAAEIGSRESTWRATKELLKGDWNSVKHGPSGAWVIAGSQGIAVRKPGETNWLPAPGASSSWRSILSSGQQWVIAGVDGLRHASETNWDWKSRDLGGSWIGAAKNDDRWLVYGHERAAILDSEGRMVHAWRTPSRAWNHAIFANGRWDLAGSKELASVHGDKLDTVDVAGMNGWRAIAFGDDRLIAAGFLGLAERPISSTNWSQNQTPDGPVPTNDIAFDRHERLWIAAGQHHLFVRGASDPKWDGARDADEQPLPMYPWSRIASDQNGTLLVIGDERVAIKRKGAKFWESAAIARGHWKQLSWDQKDKAWIAIDERGKVAVSKDGKVWAAIDAMGYETVSVSPHFDVVNVDKSINLVPRTGAHLFAANNKEFLRSGAIFRSIERKPALEVGDFAVLGSKLRIRAVRNSSSCPNHEFKFIAEGQANKSSPVQVGDTLVSLTVGADPNLSHRADRILSQGWRPVLS